MKEKSLFLAVRSALYLVLCMFYSILLILIYEDPVSHRCWHVFCPSIETKQGERGEGRGGEIGLPHVAPILNQYAICPSGSCIIPNGVSKMSVECRQWTDVLKALAYSKSIVSNYVQIFYRTSVIDAFSFLNGSVDHSTTTEIKF